MRLVALSDLHIHGSEDPVYRALLRVLATRVSPQDTLVLAGDIFDVFLGAKGLFLERYQEFFRALRRLAEQGAVIHYIEGNHDFFLEEAFEGIPQLTLAESEIALDLAGRRFYIAHGDLVDRKDYGYRVLREVLRSPALRSLVMISPGEWIDRLGTRSAELGRKSRETEGGVLPEKDQQRIRGVFRKFAAEKAREGFDFVLLGHCHDLDEKAFDLEGRPIHYANMGFPPVHGSYLVWEPGQARMTRESLFS